MKNFLILLMFVGLSAQFAFAQMCQHNGHITWEWLINGKRVGIDYGGTHSLPAEMFADLSPFFPQASTIAVHVVPELNSPDSNRVHKYVVAGKTFLASDKLNWVALVTLDSNKVSGGGNVVIGLRNYSVINGFVENEYEAYIVPVGCDFMIGKFRVGNLGYTTNFSKGEKSWVAKNRYLKWGWTKDPLDVRGEALADSIVKLVKTVKRLAVAGGWGGFTYEIFNGRDTVFTAAFYDSAYYSSRAIKRLVHYEIEYIKAGRYVSIKSEKGRDFNSGRTSSGEYEEWAMSEAGTGESITLHYPLPYWNKRLLNDLTLSGRISLIENALAAVLRCCLKSKPE